MGRCPRCEGFLTLFVSFIRFPEISDTDEYAEKVLPEKEQKWIGEKICKHCYYDLFDKLALQSYSSYIKELEQLRKEIREFRKEVK